MVYRKKPDSLEIHPAGATWETPYRIPESVEVCRMQPSFDADNVNYQSVNDTTQSN